MGSQGPVALSLLEVDKAMDHYHVDEDERIEFSLAVRKIASIIFAERAQELEDKLQRMNKK